MKKINKRNKFIIAFSICILWLVISYIIYKYYHESVKSGKKMYCYQLYWGHVNPVLYVEDKDYLDSLIQYYQKIEKGDTNPTFNFPPLCLPTDTCVYVQEYLHDSNIAKVVCYYNWGKKGFYVSGYVYSKSLHLNPAPDSLRQKYNNL